MGTSARLREWKLVFLVPTIHIFEDFSDLRPFTDRFFFVTPLYPLAHVTISGIESGVKGKCKPLFPHFWCVKHFLLENDTFIYRERNFLVEDSFKKKKVLEFVDYLNYLGRVVPLVEADKFFLKRLIDVSFLISSEND